MFYGHKPLSELEALAPNQRRKLKVNVKGSKELSNLRRQRKNNYYAAASKGSQ
jgi:hypothetical protein